MKTKSTYHKPVFTKRDMQNLRILTATVRLGDTAPQTAHPALVPADDRPDPALRGVNPRLAGIR